MSTAVLGGDRVNEMLLESGLISAEDMSEAVAVHEKTGERVVNVLMAKGALDPKKFVLFLSQPGVSKKIDIRNFDIPREIIELIPKTFALLHHVVPIERNGDQLTISTVKHLDPDTVDALAEHTGLSIKIVVCSADDVEASLVRHYVNDGAMAGSASLLAPLRLNTAIAMVRNIDSLPALPGTVNRVREMVYEDDGSSAEIGDVISQDPAISAKVLKVANSASYGFSHRVDNVPLAVSLLGVVETYSVVVSSAVVNVFDRSRTFDYPAFWLTSMQCALYARMLCKIVNPKKSAGIFSAGLLHDIGRVALLQIAPRHYEKFDNSLIGKDLVAAEERVLGLSHAEAGYELGLHWDLPREMIECIRFHHTPEFASDANREVVSMINIADVLSRTVIDEEEELVLNLEDCQESMAFIKVTDEQLRVMVQSTTQPTLADSLWSAK